MANLVRNRWFDHKFKFNIYFKFNYFSPFCESLGRSYLIREY